MTGKQHGGETPLGRPAPLNKLISAAAGRDLCYAKDPKCGTEVFGLHTCPFQSEINGDDNYQCRCCDTCEHECAMDI